MSLPILITGGDPAGVGPELLEAIFPEIKRTDKRVIYFTSISIPHIDNIKKACLKLDLNFKVLSPPDLFLEPFQDQLQRENEDGQLFLIETGDSKDAILPGKPDKRSGELAYNALRLACDYIERFGCGGLLTAPLSKEWISSGADPSFRGHTDYLKNRFGRDVIMLMHGFKFSVIPLTVHIPISTVARELRDLIQKPELISLFKKVSGFESYRTGRWALCGLNPHSGDGGILGTEENDFLIGWADSLRRNGIPLDGPLAADSLFTNEILSKYRLILSCYHDQGLIPFKALEGRRGINYTIGLPFLRTSPDHGTAFNIAGQRRADPESMRNAYLALVAGKLSL